MPLPEQHDPTGPGGSRNGYSPVNLKVDALLKPEDRREYEALLESGAGRDEAVEWLRARGYRISATAVQNHRRIFLGMLRSLRETARVSEAMTRLVREHGGPGGISDITLTRFQQIVMEKLCDESISAKDLAFKDLAEIAKVIDSAVGSRKQVQQMRREFEETKQKLAVETAKAAKRKGSDGVVVANRVREILGLPVAGKDDVEEE